MSLTPGVDPVPTEADVHLPVVGSVKSKCKIKVTIKNEVGQVISKDLSDILFAITPF